MELDSRKPVNKYELFIDFVSACNFPQIATTSNYKEIVGENSLFKLFYF